MSDMAPLLRQLLAQREQWVDVAPGKAVRLRRPLEADLDGMFVTGADGRRAFRVTLADVRRCAVGWRGFTEHDLTGNGNTDELPWDAELGAAAIGDNLDWTEAAVRGLSDLVVSRLEARVAARGNSLPTSTPQPAPTVAASS